MTWGHPETRLLACLSAAGGAMCANSLAGDPGGPAFAWVMVALALVALVIFVARLTRDLPGVT